MCSGRCPLSAQLSAEVSAYLQSDSASSLTPTERLVLLAVAERASENTSHPKMAIESGWTLRAIVGISRSGLRAVLRKLASRGLEVRVPYRRISKTYPPGTIAWQVPDLEVST